MAGELPPVVAELIADTSDFIADFTEAIELLGSFREAVDITGDAVDELVVSLDAAAVAASDMNVAIREVTDSLDEAAVAAQDLSLFVDESAESMGHLRDEALEAAAAIHEVRDAGSDVGNQLTNDLSNAGQEGGEKLGEGIKRGAQNEVQDEGGILSKLLVAGIVAGIPVAGGAIVAAFAGVFAGIAVFAQKGNKQVSDAFSGLAETVTTDVRNMTSAAVPALVGAAHSLVGVFTGLEPELQTAFTGALPAIGLLTDGVERLVKNAMPGLVQAAQAAVPVFTGLEHTLGGLGSFLGSLASSFAGGADSIKGALTDLGSLLRSLGDTIGAVVHGALPGLAGGFGGLVGTLSSFLGALQPIAPAIGAIAGLILPLVGDFKLFQLMATPVGKLGDAVTSLSDKLVQAGTVSRQTGSQIASFGAGISKLGSALPFLGTAISFFLSIAQSLGPDLQQIQQDLLAGGNAAETAAGQFSKFAFLPNSFSSITNGLNAVQKAQLLYNLAVAKFGPTSSQAKLALQGYSQASGEAAKEQNILNQAQRDVASQAAQAGVSINAYKGALDGVAAAAKGLAAPEAASNVNQLATDLSVLGTTSSTVTQKISALQNALKLMSEGGMEAANDEIAQFYNGLSTLAQQLGTDKGKILDANGALDLTSQKGRDVFSAMEQARDSMAGYAQNAAEANAPSAEINSHLQALYSTLEKQLLPSFGNNKKAVDQLLDSLALTPKQIETTYSSNADDATSKANGVNHAVSKIPTSWFTKIGSNAGFFDTQMGTARKGVTAIPTVWNTQLKAHDLISSVARGAQASVNGLHGKTITITAVLSGVNQIFGEINGLISGAGHSAGRALGSGILSGVQSALDIHSPSRVMASQVGKPITDGIAVGMVNGMDSIRSATTTLQRAISATGGAVHATVGATLPAGVLSSREGARGGGGTGTIVINNNIAGTVVAEKSISQVNRTQVLRYNQRNPTNGLSLFGRGSS